MAAVTSLVPDIRAEIPELPSFAAERQLLRATRIFCKETRAWRVSVSVSVVAGTPTVNLVTLFPATTELVDIISIKDTNGYTPLKPRTYSWLDTNLSDWRDETNNTASYYVRSGNNTIQLVPTPSATVASLYDARVAVQPTLAATVIDDVLVNRYDEDIIHGALGLLYAMPRKPWTDANLAQYHKSMFEDSWPTARAQATDEFQTGVPRTVKYGGL